MSIDIALDRIERHLRTLVETIGPRVAGSVEDQRAIDYIVGALKDCGVETRRHEIASPCWQHRRTSLTTVSTGEALSAHASQYSCSGDVVGDVLVLGTMREANNADVAGKICLMSGAFGGDVSLRDLVALALQARGAKALLVNRPLANPDAYDGKWVREPDLRDIPVAAVSSRVAEKIAASRSPVRLVVDASFWWGHTDNVEAVVPGRGPGRVFVTSHHDTGAGAPGAGDNGAGVAVSLELARVFAGETPPCELRFFFEGGHERLDQGSREYFRQHQDLLRETVMGCTLDGIGQKQGVLRAIGTGPDGFVERLSQVLSRNPGWELRREYPPADRAAATPFERLGVPTVWLRTMDKDPSLDVYHTQTDDLAVLDMGLVGLTATTAADVLASEPWR